MADFDYRWMPNTIVVKHRNIMLTVTRVGEYILRKQGFLVRQIAKSLMKDATGPNDHAPAGQPPLVHKGQLKNLMRYEYRRDTASVVVGPDALPGGFGTAPATLEFGGHTTVPSAEWHWKTRNGKAVIEHQTVTTNLLPRPYMGPALEIAKPQLAEFWRNAVAA